MIKERVVMGAVFVVLSTQKAWTVRGQTVLEQHNDLSCFSALRVVLQDSLKTELLDFAIRVTTLRR